MSRSQWAHVAAWLFLAACCLTAGMTTYVQVTRRLSAIRANSQTRRDIAKQEQELRQQDQIRQVDIQRLLSTNSLREDAAFLQQLQRLIARSGAKAARIESVPISPLPDISEAHPAGSSPPNMSSHNDQSAPSLNHLPLNVEARSTRVVLVGDFVEIRRFLGILASYSSTTMWINTNSLRLDRSDNPKNLRATLVITRFIRAAPVSYGAR